MKFCHNIYARRASFQSARTPSPYGEYLWKIFCLPDGICYHNFARFKSFPTSRADSPIGAPTAAKQASNLCDSWQLV